VKDEGEMQDDEEAKEPIGQFADNLFSASKERVQLTREPKKERTWS